MHDDAPLGGVFDGVAEKEARGACAGLVEFNVNSNDPVVAAAADPKGFGDTPS